MRNRILCLTFIFSVAVALSLVQAQEKSPKPGDLYDQAIELFYRGKYEEALDGFSQITRLHPTSMLVSYSNHMIGRCLLGMGKYEEAVRQFELYLKTYPDGDRVKEARKGLEDARKKLAELEEAERKKSISKKEPVPSLPGEQAPSWKTGKGKRRVCAQVFYLDAKNLEEVEKRIKEMKGAGVDTLIFRVFQNKGDRIYQFASPMQEEGVYFKTGHAPVVDDLLGKIVEIAHRNGLEFFAWMTTRYANYGLDGHPEWRCKRYNFEMKRLDLARGFNLFHPEVLQRLRGLFRDLGRYPIDGILFQDDLILKHNEGFDHEATKAFLKEFGYPPHPDLFYIDPYPSESGKYYVKAYSERFWEWARWKNRWLMKVAGQLMQASRESNPRLTFGINLYYETVLNHSNSVAWFSQSLEEARKIGFDYYAIMAYHRQTLHQLKMEEKKVMSLMAEVTRKALQALEDPSRVMIKVQILDWKNYTVIPQKEVETLLGGILKQGKVSLAFVPYIEQFPLQKLKGKWSSP